MLEIRRLEAGDWPLWREVRLRALAEAPAAFGSSLADWSGSGDREERWRARLDDVAANFVVFLEGNPSGQVSGAHPAQPANTAQREEVELLSMWVSPEARGAGVGDALVEAVAAWALDVGAEFLTLSVKVGNDPAIGLYQRHGFARRNAAVADGEFEMVKRLS